MKTKLKINFIFLMGLGLTILGLSFSTVVYSQSDANRNVEYVEDEGHDSEEVERVINDYRKQNKDISNMIQQMNSDGTISNAEKKKLLDMYSNNNPAALKQMDTSKMLSKLGPKVDMVNSMFSRMSYQEARNQIQTNIDSTPAKGLFAIAPKMVDFVTHMLRDKRALKSLLLIFKDKAKLFQFLIANIVVFILGFFILRKSKEASFLERLVKWFTKKGLLTSVRLGILIFFFGTELGPTWTVFTNVFF